MNRFLLLTTLLLTVTALTGCVERRYTIRSEPVGALLILDGESIGPTPQTIPFVFYGTHKVQLQHEGRTTTAEYIEIAAPYWQYFPIDFLSEFLYPGTLVDEREFAFTLGAAKPFDENDFMNRAQTAQGQSDNAE